MAFYAAAFPRRLELVDDSTTVNSISGDPMERCKQCKKVLFKKKDGRLVCPNGCDEHHQRSAFNTVIDPSMERRNKKPYFDPWNSAR